MKLCEKCGGVGQIFYSTKHSYKGSSKDCPKCKGKGVVTGGYGEYLGDMR